MTQEPVSRRAFFRVASGGGLALATVLALPGRAHAAAQLVSVECPILTYHEVTSRLTFARQIRGYLERGYQPIGLGQLRQLLVGEDLGLRGKPFIITFDDGLASARDNALPFLMEWQLPAVFAVMPDSRGDRVHRYMTNDDLRALVNDYGYEVISHTLDHANLVRERTRNFGSWQAQIVESRARLEEIVGNGYQCEGFCFPFGAYDAPTLSLVGEHYTVALSTRPGTIQRSDQRLHLRRTSMS